MADILKLIRRLTLYLLIAIIILGIIVDIYLFETNGVLFILISCIGLFLIIIPHYTLFWLINIGHKKMKDDIYAMSKAIDDFSKDSIEQIKVLPYMNPIVESISRLYARKKQRQHLNELLNNILVCAATNLELDQFIENSMDDIMEIVNSSWSAFYIVNSITNKLEIKASKGFGKSIYSQFDINIGEGFVGKAALNNKISIIRDIPDDTIYMAKSFIGTIKPKNLLIVPVADEDNVVLGIFVSASLYEYNDEDIEIMNKIRKYISFAVKNGNHYNKSIRITNELKFQNQLIQNMNDDLENKVHERTIFLNNIINSITDTAIISIDNNNQVKMFNNGAEQLLNIKYNDIIEKNVTLLADGVYNMEKKIQENIYEAIAHDRSADLFDFVRSDGKHFSINMELFVVYDEVGERNGVTIVMRDMSDINKIINSASSDRKLNDILISESSRALVITDSEGMIYTINKNAEYILSISGKEAIESNIVNYFENSENLKSIISQASSNNDKKTTSEILIKTGMSVKIEINVILSGLADEVKLLMYLH